MHDHNDGSKDGGHKGMMWMMLICCTLPFVVLIFGSGTGSGYLIPILIGILIIVHLWMMFKGHGDKNEKQ